MSKELIAIDYAGIESRLVAWVAGDTRKLAAFEAYDRGEGPNNYILAGSQVFQMPAEKIKKGSVFYILSKIVELAMGFEGGVGALIKAFQKAEPETKLSLNDITDLAWGKMHPKAMESAEWMWENGYLKGHDLPKKTLLVLDAMKSAWRLGHPAVADKHNGVWRQLRDAAIQAVRNPGTAYTINTGLIRFGCENGVLYARLPSGRKMAYRKPEVVGEEGSREEHLDYFGMDTEKRIFMRTGMYGGKWMQNVAEGIGRDLLVHGMMNLERAGAPMVMTVHDEAVGEMDAGLLTMDQALKIFLDRPKWSVGLPLAAEGWIGKRYRK